KLSASGKATRRKSHYTYRWRKEYAGSGISAKVFSGAEKMQGKPCLTTGRRATARCIMKGTGLETDGMMA
ncbi:hypothetical protein, partial [Bilophila wadsworthia]|uniref:hypothetical protein n=1 Tax=Bilophila wadsworthia TaxID=35833 RepID=UPI003AB34493